MRPSNEAPPPKTSAADDSPRRGARSSSEATPPGTADRRPRLAPVEKPASLRVRLAYKVVAWTEGHVPTPMKVVQARLPQSLRHAYETRRVEASLSLPPGLRLLVKRYIAHLNGCAFCVDLAEARAEAQGMDVALLRRAAEHRQSDRVAERDRAALRFAREATETVHVGDETFAAVRDHFSEREIVELTWLCATENYWNRITGPLGIGSDGLCPV